MLKDIAARSASAAMIFTLLFPIFSITAKASADRPLTEDQKILHVLNRLGYGPRPGDLEKVRSIGLKKYIEMQLNPTLINDNAAETKLKSLEVFDMTTAEIFAKYPNPGAVKRYLSRDKKNSAQRADAADEQTPAEKQAERKRVRELYREYGLQPASRIIAQINAGRVLRAAYSERQLQEVMVDFWQN